MKARPKPANQPLEAGRVSTMALIFSVTVPKVWPGSITGARSSSTVVLYGSFMRLRQFPQGLKPPFLFAFLDGAAEAAPFQNCPLPRALSTVLFTLTRTLSMTSFNRPFQPLPFKSAFLRFQIRIWVAHFRQIGCTRTSVEFAQQTVIAGLLLQL